MRIECPDCDKPIRVPDDRKGTTVRCPHCKSPIKVPGKTAADRSSPEREGITDRKKTAPTGKVARKTQLARRDEEDEDDRPRRSSPKRSSEDRDERPSQKRRVRDDDTDGDEDEKASAPPAKKKKKKESGSPLVWILAGVGSLLVVGGVILAIVLGTGSKKAHVPVAENKGPAPAAKAPEKDDKKPNPPLLLEKLPPSPPPVPKAPEPVNESSLFLKSLNGKWVLDSTYSSPDSSVFPLTPAWNGFVIDNGKMTWTDSKDQIQKDSPIADIQVDAKKEPVVFDQRFASGAQAGKTWTGLCKMHAGGLAIATNCSDARPGMVTSHSAAGAGRAKFVLVYRRAGTPKLPSYETPDPTPVAKPVPPLANAKVIYQADGTIQQADPLDSARSGSHFKNISLVFESGKTYAVELKSPSSSKVDPYLRLLDGNGSILSQDDNSGGNKDSRIIYKSPQAGSYTAVATTAGPDQFGAFKIVISELNSSSKPAPPKKPTPAKNPAPPKNPTPPKNPPPPRNPPPRNSPPSTNPVPPPVKTFNPPPPPPRPQPRPKPRPPIRRASLNESLKGVAFGEMFEVGRNELLG